MSSSGPSARGPYPTTAEVAEAHAHVRKEIEKIMGSEGTSTCILYGGSVKPSNATELMSALHVNGALVGGALAQGRRFHWDYQDLYVSY
ncbi:MAG: triose-phosphate isomerase [Hyphomicrobiales bacterium]